MPNFWDCKNTIFFITNATGCFFLIFIFKEEMTKTYYIVNQIVVS